MPTFESGAITGIYYIPVSGLPWKCSWQQLKDFVRKPQHGEECIDIDHVFVYPNSTNAFVRVIGHEKFRLALSMSHFRCINQRGIFTKALLGRLQGGILGNRSLMADGRNETGRIYIRDYVSLPSASPSGANEIERLSVLSPSIGGYYTYPPTWPSPRESPYAGVEDVCNFNVIYLAIQRH
jgi:hypothetical protein